MTTSHMSPGFILDMTWAPVGWNSGPPHPRDAKVAGTLIISRDEMCLLLWAEDELSGGFSNWN